jgi:2-oxoacid:acceptor oxidoreductase gamma subunit (pyruvate/2-ketoisovalerate family)
LIEVRLHGRGGQGCITAALVLIEAALNEGKWGQKIPVYGGERRGAPVLAYMRLDDTPIRQTNFITNPDWIVVIDEGLDKIVDVTAGLKEGGIAILNDRKAPEEIDLGVNLSKIATVDATAISAKLFGRRAIPITNTIMLGAISAAPEVVKFESLVEPIKTRFPGPIGERNVEAAKLGYESVKWVDK